MYKIYDITAKLYFFVCKMKYYVYNSVLFIYVQTNYFILNKSINFVHILKNINGNKNYCCQIWNMYDYDAIRLEHENFYL